MSLVCQPPLLHRPGRLRPLSCLGYDQCAANQLGQPFVCCFAVLLLTPSVARDDSHVTVSIEPTGELFGDPRSRRVIQRPRPSKVPEKLDARRRCVDVLTARAT